MREELFHQDRETLAKEAKRPHDLSNSTLAGRKRKGGLTYSVEEGVNYQLDDYGLSFDLKRTLVKDLTGARRQEEKKCKGGGDKDFCGKCFKDELSLKN